MGIMIIIDSSSIVGEEDEFGNQSWRVPVVEEARIGGRRRCNLFGLFLGG